MKMIARTAWRTALACGALVGMGHVTAQMTCVGYGDAGTWFEAADCTATVCSDGKEPAEFEFKDENGNVIQEISMEAAGCVKVPIPSGTASYDWKKKEPPEEPFLALSAPGLPPVLPTSWGMYPDHYLMGGGSVALGCLSTEVRRNEPAVAYAFRVHTTDFDTAGEMVAPIIQGGPGTPVPPAVTVGSFVSLVHDGVTATIRSSLPYRFDHYVIDVDGLVVADLQTGRAAEVSSGGQGWVTITTELPLLTALPGQTVTLRQKGRQDTEAAELVMELF
jgi:hypothetical protein